jgi:hypothetical protein
MRQQATYTTTIGTFTTLTQALTDIKNQIASNLTNNVPINWSASETLTLENQQQVLWLKPSSSDGKTALRRAMVVSKQVPRSVTVVQLDDSNRSIDNFHIPIHRVASNGVIYANTVAGHIPANLARWPSGHIV